MDRENEKIALERKLAKYRELLREVPDGPIGELLRDLIEEWEQQLRLLEE